MTKGLRPATIAGASHTLATTPRAPSHLPAAAKKEWNRVAPILVERGVLTEADLGLLESYAIAFGIMRDCQRQLAAEGLTYLNARGEMKRHPANGILNEASNRFRLLSNEFGLSPVSRSRTAFPDADEAEDAGDLGL